jgi:propanol-preferring alcohol dehydrogenase
MKGVVFTGDRQLEVRELPVPEPGPEQALVRMVASSICGTDMHFYRKTWEELVEFRQSFNGSPDTIPGHEPCGVVEAVGANVTAVAPGDRVTVYQHVGCGSCGYCCRGEVMFCPERTGYGSVHNGSCADYTLAPARNCMRIPDALSFDRAVVLSCAGGTAYQSIQRIDPSGADTVGIFGLGPVGLCATAFAVARGARVVGLDLQPERLRLARAMGAERVIDVADQDAVAELMEMTGGRGLDAAADYSGSPRAQQAMVAAAGKWARLGLVGVGDPFELDAFRGMIMRQLTLMGSWIYNLGQYEEIVDHVLERDIPLEELITHRYSIDQAEEAFRVFDAGATGKVLFTWES